MHQFKSFDIKAAGDGGSFTGYAATFDREADFYGDVIAAGAFADTLREWAGSGKTIPVFYGHRMDDPDMLIGRVSEAREDERGLYVEGELFNSEKAQTVRARINDGTLSKMSFAYDIVEDGRVTLGDGTKAHELRKLRLLEVSVVPSPANVHAEITGSKAEGDEPEPEPEEDNEQGDAMGQLDELRQKLADAMSIIDQLAEGGQDEPSADGDEGGEDGSKAQGEPDEGQPEQAKAMGDIASKYARFLEED